MTACFAASAPAAADICAICGMEIPGTVYIVTDKVAGKDVLICSNCLTLPRCFICGLPVKEGEVVLPDGRRLCARDARTAVLDAGDAARVCAGVENDLDRLFSRFTSFPPNVDVSVIDRVDVDAKFDTVGHTFESPDVLGWMQTKTNGGQVRYEIGLLTGLPLADLKATCAHEFSHAWVAENVPRERHERLGRDAEEGFCELISYLLMDSQREEERKKFILENHYTRGQAALFIEAEKRCGINQVLDWMEYGKTAQLEAGRLDELRNVKMPSENTIAVKPAAEGGAATGNFKTANINSPAPVSEPATINLQGILLGNKPMAIINGHSFFANEKFRVKIGATNVIIRCVGIQKDSVRVQNVDSGREEALHFGSN
ncbi:MAG: protein DA1 [Verrucomicrobiota bacterium]|jgi:hypothetical protein